MNDYKLNKLYQVTFEAKYVGHVGGLYIFEDSDGNQCEIEGPVMLELIESPQNCDIGDEWQTSGFGGTYVKIDDNQWVLKENAVTYTDKDLERMG